MTRVDLEIHEDVVTTIRELEPGQYYITTMLMRKGGKLRYLIRKRGDTPFKATTLFGSRCQSTPSQKVHPVTILS